MIVTTITTARSNFNYAIGDVSILLKTHDTETKRNAGRPDRNLEVFKRAGVILAITAWEAYIEDTLAAQFSERLKKATSPHDIKRAFNSVSHSWLSSQPKPPELAKWTGEGWKDAIREKFNHDVSALNTPDSANIKVLFERYLDLDITKYWRWSNICSSKACEKLDELIHLRGELVHKGKEIFDLKAKVLRRNLLEAKQTIERLVACTDRALDIAPVEINL
ncbi:MAG TPA: HEPN domain-containing protein [Candidatus Angelobacter sp.]|nr:HEPN domain-containing protein [Candidatus Angelobacter sp.]